MQKFPDSVGNEIYAYKNKHSLRRNTMGYGRKIHYTDSKNSDTIAQVAESCTVCSYCSRRPVGNFGYTLINLVHSDYGVKLQIMSARW
jgi:hypothetical protein